MKKRSRLSKEEKTFLEHYFTHLSARKAAKAAGFHPSHGYRLLRQPHIKKVVEEVFEAEDLTVNELRVRLARLVRTSLGDVITVHEDGSWTVDIPKAIETGAIDAITEIKTKKGGLVEVKQVDRLRALFKAMQLLGMTENAEGDEERDWWSALEEDSES